MITLYSNVFGQCSGPLNIIVEGSSTGSPLTLEFISNDIYCLGTDDGAIEVIITGGTPDYSCQWDNGEITPDIVDLSPGTYAITVTDGNNCTSILSINVLEIDPISDQLELIEEEGCGTCYLDDGSHSFFYSGDKYMVNIVDVIDGVSMAQTDVCTYFHEQTLYIDDIPLLDRSWDIDAVESNSKVTVYFTGEELNTFAAASGYESIQKFILNADLCVKELKGGAEKPDDYVSVNTINNPTIIQSDIVNDVWSLDFFATTFGTFYLTPCQLPDSLFLVNFEGWLEGPDNHLRWNTINETINKGFSLEKSEDGLEFEELWYTQGMNEKENQYDYIDTDPFMPSTFYRLRQENFDGKSRYSHIVHLKREEEMRIYLLQNPVSDWIELRTENFNDPHSGTIFITDELGQIMHTTMFANEIVYSERVNISHLTAGTYFFTIELSDMAMKKTYRFIKV